MNLRDNWCEQFSSRDIEKHLFIAALRRPGPGRHRSKTFGEGGGGGRT